METVTIGSEAGMARHVGLALAGLCVLGISGCRVFPGFECYGDALDSLTDVDVVFDREYVPRLDISRAGKPDWCGPINQKLAPCRCLYGTWKRYDDCWLYPPSYPYWYPGDSLHRVASQSEHPRAPSLPSNDEPSLFTPEPLMPAPPAESTPQTLPPAPVPDLQRSPAQESASPSGTPAAQWRPRQVH